MLHPNPYPGCIICFQQFIICHTNIKNPLNNNKEVIRLPQISVASKKINPSESCQTKASNRVKKGFNITVMNSPGYSHSLFFGVTSN